MTETDETDDTEDGGAALHADIAALKLIVTLLLSKLDAAPGGLKLTNAVKAEALKAVADLPVSDDDVGQRTRQVMENSVRSLVSKIGPI